MEFYDTLTFYVHHMSVTQLS